MSEEPRAKSRWCEQCKRRHDLNHEHFKDTKADRKADTVTGSKSGADLANKAAQGKSSTQQVAVSKDRLEKEKAEILREARERRWQRRNRLMFGAWAKLSDDKTKRMSDEELLDGGYVGADFDEAWGIGASGKIDSTLELFGFYLMAVAARSTYMQEALAALHKQKKELEEAECSRTSSSVSPE